MSGDYTRFTFDPTKVFSGVHKQQGRVSLDADFNEFEEILDRRDRTEMYDTVGPAVVPATTPDGFEIGVDGAGNLTIGIGRVYVDGIGVECFGDMSDPKLTVFDAAINDLVGSGPLPIAKQPFGYPTIPAISPTTGTVNLVYLDAWQREVTVWEDPSLLDPALGGPDTATRIQTAWQVKAFQAAGTDTDLCANPPADWLKLIAPSTARMSATAAKVPPAPGPCIIQPAGGYVGLENRLYRVEIQKAGTIGGTPRATFKWSRDNASLVASVTGIVPAGTGSIITVDSTGRDSWMRFEVPQQIELLDDRVEFAMRESGTGGQIGHITAVNHATGEITIQENLSAFPIAKERHPRIRRWDTAAPADDAVRNVNNGTPIALEEGIFVTFGDLSPAHDGDTLHAGDFWVFAARTADGSIETVLNEPPRDILHHYMKLAVVTSGAPPTIIDCRDPWPVPCDCEGGGCDCDACVTEESHASGSLTIQQAITNVIDAGGGTVCIGIGQFPIEGTGILISGAVSLRVRGSGIATIIEFTGEGPALKVQASIDVVVRDLTVITQRRGDTMETAVEVGNAALIDLDRLVVIEDPIAVIAGLSQDGGLSRRGGAAIGLRGFVIRTTIADCVLAGGYGIIGTATTVGNTIRSLVVADLAITHDLMFATDSGIALGDDNPEGAVTFVDRTAITACSIYGCSSAGVVLAGTVVEGEIVVRDNAVGVQGQGMFVATDRTIVADNTIGSWSRTSRAGISLVSADRSIRRDVHLERNRISRFSRMGIGLETDVASVGIDANIITGCGGGIVMSARSAAETITVDGNTIVDVVSREDDDQLNRFGIALFATTDGRITENTVKRVALRGQARLRAGILTVGCRSVRVAGNTVEEVGPDQFDGVSVGIGAVDGFERLDVFDNTVRPDRERVAGEWYALLIGEFDAGFAKTSFVVGGVMYYAAGASVSIVGKRERANSVGVRGNRFEASGRTPTVQIATEGSCIFSDNSCRQLDQNGNPVVAMVVAIVALTSNQVRQDAQDDSVAILVEGVVPALTPTPLKRAISAVGNLTDGRIIVNGAALPAPWAPLNVRLT